MADKEEVKEETSTPSEEKEEVKEETSTPSEGEKEEVKEVERTPLEEAVGEEVNSGVAKQLAKLDEKFDIIIGLLTNKAPDFDAHDSEEVENNDNSDETSKAELEAIENILD